MTPIRKKIRLLALRLAWELGFKAATKNNHPEGNPFALAPLGGLWGDMKLAWSHGHGCKSWTRMIDGYQANHMGGDWPCPSYWFIVPTWANQKQSCLDMIRRKGTFPFRTYYR